MKIKIKFSKLQLAVLGFFFIHFCSHVAQANDNSNIMFSKAVKIGEKLYLLSNVSLNSVQAHSACSSINGKMAQLDTNVKDILLPIFEDLYLKDLTFVNIYQRPDDPNVMKYRAVGGIVTDSQWIGQWLTPPTGRLSGINLYSRQKDGFRAIIRFCYYWGRDSIRTTCDGGWIDNFDLYGGNSNTSNTIPLYNYQYKASDKDSGNLFLNYFEHNSTFVKVNPPIIYLPDISVFSGAQSDVGEIDWYWDNETIVQNQDYPMSNASVCQQMTWPLTYDDGINLLPKDCDTKTAYFTCHPLFSANLSPADCANTKYQLTWNRYLFGTELYEANAPVKIALSTGQVYHSYLKKGKFLLTNVTMTIALNIEVEVILRQTRSTVSTNVSAGTAESQMQKPPAPVQYAVVKSFWHSCIIEWKETLTDESIAFYKIKSFSMDTSEEVELDVLSFEPVINQGIDDAILFYSVDLKRHGLNNEIRFTIQSGNCKGYSEPTNVTGSCFGLGRSPPCASHDKQLLVCKTSSVGLWIGINVAVVVVLVVIVAAILIWKKKQGARKEDIQAPTYAIVDKRTNHADKTDSP